MNLPQRWSRVGWLALVLVSAGCNQPSLLYEGQPQEHANPAQDRLVRITAVGLEPARIQALEEDSASVVFLNDTTDCTVRVVFPDHVASHLSCSFTQNFNSSGGSTFTRYALPPGGMASICLHDAGHLDYRVETVAGDGLGPFVGFLEVRPAGPRPGRQKEGKQ